VSRDDTICPNSGYLLIRTSTQSRLKTHKDRENLVLSEFQSRNPPRHEKYVSTFSRRDFAKDQLFWVLSKFKTSFHTRVAYVVKVLLIILSPDFSGHLEFYANLGIGTPSQLR